MKKIISIFLTGIIISIGITTKVKAQSEKGIAFAAIKNIPALASYVNENTSSNKDATSSTKESVKAAEMELKSSKATLKALKANYRATENFRKTFKDAPEASWKVEEEVIVASFSKDAVKTSVVYNKKGSLIHTLSYYPADKTPEDIRLIVENDYPNADITLAVQVKENDMEFYIVQLEDKRTYKQVGVYNGATNLIKEFTKSR